MRLERRQYKLGRAQSNDLCFTNVVGLSREHLVLEQDGANWVVRDLGSTNGTFINGKRIREPHVLLPEDRIAIGQLILTFHERKPADPAGHTVMFVEKDSSTSEETTMAGSVEGLLSQEGRVTQGNHIKALIHAGRELSTHLPVDKLFDLILDLSVEAVGGARGVLMTLENEVLEARSTRGANFRISSHVRDVVINQKRSLLVRDTMMDVALASRVSIVQDQIRSIIAAPLQTDDRVIGLIYIDSPDYIRAFTKEDLNLLTVMANMAAVRIENARLAEVEQAQKLRDRELEHAAMIQRSMLPGDKPPFPDRKDFQLKASMIPAKEVGGDLFDFFLLDEHHLGFVVGDVSGKSVPAALFMAVSRTLLKANAQHGMTPGDCLTYMNRFLTSGNSSGMYVTIFYGVLDTRSGEIQFANGGHNPPYLFSSDGRVRPLTDGGPIVGILEGINYSTHSDMLAPGEGILVYTDGVTEAPDPKGEFFGNSRLESWLAERKADSPELMVRSLQKLVLEFAGGTPQADDITVLALRYAGASRARN